MSILQKSAGAPFICKVYLDFNGSLTPTNSEENQNFYNSVGNQYTWKPLYFSITKVNFTETPKEISAGTQYTQSLSISFPNSDALRTDRIEKIKTTKFVRLELSNGVSIVLGRNDFFQNKPLSILATSTANKTTISFKTITMFSVGVLQINDVSHIIDFLIPTENPNNFIAI
ncbi:hypothetical protein [Polaribacter atrinae]|mgnify:CR=1 FL=1|uniref:hypothetical protein n=1 Tax=Polaribacter atrinae TaxID=1333662 RepID=UPI0030F52874